ETDPVQHRDSAEQATPDAGVCQQADAEQAAPARRAGGIERIETRHEQQPGSRDHEAQQPEAEHQALEVVIQPPPETDQGKNGKGRQHTRDGCSGGPEVNPAQDLAVLAGRYGRAIHAAPSPRPGPVATQPPPHRPHGAGVAGGAPSIKGKTETGPAMTRYVTTGSR